jgi:four helix bundle protein
LPKNEYELVDNMKRAVRSTTRNIAEGFGRHHFQETMQYTRISRGSMQETWDDLITCFEAGYIEMDVYKRVEQEITKSLALINGYIAY